MSTSQKDLLYLGLGFVAIYALSKSFKTQPQLATTTRQPTTGKLGVSGRGDLGASSLLTPAVVGSAFRIGTTYEGNGAFDGVLTDPFDAYVAKYSGA